MPEETAIHHPSSTSRRWLTAALCGLLALPLTAAPAGRPVESLVRERGLDPAQLIRPWEPGPNLRRWAARQAVGRPPAERLRVAFHQLLDVAGVALAFEAGTTGTADQVFASRRANCLGFALLFVGVARELGVEAGFFRVDRADLPRQAGGVIDVSEAVTAGYRAEDGLRLVEFALDPEVDYRRARPISDLSAMALYYTSRGAEALRGGDPGEAVRWLEVAVRLDDAEAAAWSNLGVARGRLGQLETAEAAYRRAIDLEPDRLTAYVHLARLLALRGEAAAARHVVSLLERGGDRGPHAYLTLGDVSLEEGRLEDARRFYRRAVRAGRGDAEPLAAMGLWALASGDPSGARRWLRRARRLDRLDARTVRLEQQLTRSSPTPGAAAAAARPEQSEREVES